ncbi:hypothetical protein Lalb_Chr05g0216271 [Lupinus albus]|uniref:Uncharacterized protein n=1 Tax=Lupinus albus TaxID=3870 RepID=A0A6A4QJD6_LUPAL|nr:hypothetical protein Lalb_Chr05g0216271 [Lupinus albus]
MFFFFYFILEEGYQICASIRINQNIELSRGSEKSMWVLWRTLLIACRISWRDRDGRKNYVKSEKPMILLHPLDKPSWFSWKTEACD